MLLAVFPGPGCGIFLAEMATPAQKRVLGAAVDMLAGMPSIVMGLFGFMLILLLRHTILPDANTGLLLAAGYLRLWGRVKRYKLPLIHGSEERLSELCAQEKIGRPPRLFRVSGLKSPCLVGIVRPAILLPRELPAEALAPDDPGPVLPLVQPPGVAHGPGRPAGHGAVL